jgi:hypothetical protein
MKLWPRIELERFIRRAVLAVMTIDLGLWFGGKLGFFFFSKDTLNNLQGGWLILFAIKSLLDARARNLGEANPGLDEPPPAVMLTILIVLTGAAGVAAAIRGGPEASADVPYMIAVGTILLAILGYILASRHKDQIGEARFKSPPEQP